MLEKKNKMSTLILDNDLHIAVLESVVSYIVD